MTAADGAAGSCINRQRSGTGIQIRIGRGQGDGLPIHDERQVVGPDEPLIEGDGLLQGDDAFFIQIVQVIGVFGSGAWL